MIELTWKETLAGLMVGLWLGLGVVVALVTYTDEIVSTIRYLWSL